MINNMEFARQARGLLAQANRVTIPYVAGGGNMSGMDCQGLIEYLMRQCGVVRNWAGSNDMWRNALKWAGTPEAFCERFGFFTVPDGAGMFIVENDGGEPREYKDTDEKRFGGSKGNASHVGLYMGDGKTLHASGSVGKVCESVKFDGRNAVPNGGWNMVGLWADVDYGANVEAAIAEYDYNSPDSVDSAVLAQETQDEQTPAFVPATPNLTPPAPKYAYVYTTNGKPANLRPQREKGKLWWHVDNGTRVEVERRKDGWALISAVCVDGVQRRAWMMETYLRYEG